MNERIKAGGDINAGDGGYNLSTQERYEEFAKQRSKVMNKLIKELAEQAGLYDEKTPEEVPEFTASFEKFAELIVRECANIDFRRELGLSNNQDYEVSQLIKKHFGVKE